jgi:hypothetical protein
MKKGRAADPSSLVIHTKRLSVHRISAVRRPGAQASLYQEILVSLGHPGLLITEFRAPISSVIAPRRDRYRPRTGSR